MQKYNTKGRSLGGPRRISWGTKKSSWKGAPDSHEGKAKTFFFPMNGYILSDPWL